MDVLSRRSRLLSWGGFVGVVVGLAALAIWLFLQFSGGDLDRGDKLASIVSMSVSLTTLPLSVFAIILTLRQGQQPRQNIQIAEHLDAIAEILAISVRAQWESEERIRRIHDPFPLPARWTIAADHVMDYWANINGAPDRRDPIALDGQGDHLVDTFSQIPSGRLVVLGRAGAGKTILSSRFVLTLLANRSLVAGWPVPVIFSLGSWNPTTRSLRGWLAEQLINTYPVLAERNGSQTTMAEQLLVTGRIMPVLDGFDEIPEGLRADAIVGINAGLRAGDRLLLTSRPEEYAAAVLAGDVLTAAAVVLLKDLTAEDVRSYLPLTTRKTSISAAKWKPVLDRAYDSSGFPALADVLSTPLMVTLARTIFSDSNADPAELLDFTSVAELEERLLAGFVPAVYSRARHDNPPCRAEDAHRHLAFLATHLQRLSTYDLAWWQLVTALPRTAFGLGGGLVIGLMTWLGLGLPGMLGAWTGDGRTAWLAASVVVAVFWGLAGCILIGVGLHMHPPSPRRMKLRIAGRLGEFGHDISDGLRNWRSMVWFLVWSVNGAVFGLASSVFLDSEAGVADGFVVGLLVGIGTGLVASIDYALTERAEPTETISPAELLNTDRATALRQGSIIGIGWATVWWLTIWFTFEPAFGLPLGRVFPPGVWLLGWLLAASLGALVWILFVPVWGPWLIARTWLPLIGRLPWRVMTFLADAHQRGVLRQAGGVYQFRHARLQDHLARHVTGQNGHSHPT